jgi:hypothetical protein
VRIVIITFLAFFIASVMPAYAGTVPSTCDPQFMDVLENRAWMEGKRQQEIAQRLIVKQDSVLEYSCFNTRLNELSVQSQSILRFSGGLILAPAVGRNVGRGLNMLVRDSFTNYMNNNFAHTGLGGMMPNAPGNNCDVMNLVWSALRCFPFDDNTFLTLTDLQTIDPRNIPLACNEPNRPQKWTAATLAAFPVPALPAAAGGMDQSRTWLNLLDPANCTNVRPIPTGLRKTSTQLQPTYDDKVCPAAACWYNPNANSGAGGCVP